MIHTKRSVFVQHKRMLHERVWHYQRLTWHDYDELISLAMFVFAKTYDKYRKADTKDKFSTWLYRSLTHALINYCFRNDVPNDDVEELIAAIPSSHKEWQPDERLMFKETILELSGEAREVIMLFLTGPAEVLKIVGDESKKEIRGRLVHHLHKKQGWSLRQVFKTFREIKQVVATL